MNADFQILIDGRSIDLGDLKNCTYNGPIKLTATTAEIEIVVNGFTPSGSGGSNASEWFFEFTNLMYVPSVPSDHPTDDVGPALLNW